ncbi:MAG: hypothetical protein ABIO79_04275 [Ferruginibacter sp.]
MKYTLAIISCCLLFACNDPFINHKLKHEKAADDCNGISESIKMLSNINGERYQFYTCLDEGFDGKNYKVTRMGDSIVVDFPKSTTNKMASYKLTLDVDAKPAYHHIVLDGREVAVVPSQR